MPAMKMTAQDKKYMGESDLRTLIEAEKIKKDKPRYSGAMNARKEQIAAMQAVGKGDK